jgi:hypothetical protein
LTPPPKKKIQTQYTKEIYFYYNHAVVIDWIRFVLLKTSLTPPCFIEVPVIKPLRWLVMYLCTRSIDITSFYIFLYCILELFQQCSMFYICYFITSAYNYNLIAKWKSFFDHRRSRLMQSYIRIPNICCFYEWLIDWVVIGNINWVICIVSLFHVSIANFTV